MGILKTRRGQAEMKERAKNLIPEDTGSLPSGETETSVLALNEFAEKVARRGRFPLRK